MDVIYILTHWHFPAPEQIEVSISLGVITLFALWPLRFFMHKVETFKEGTNRERARVVKLHVKERHKSALRTCMEGQCATLAAQKGYRAQGLSAALAAEIAQSVHH